MKSNKNHEQNLIRKLRTKNCMFKLQHYTNNSIYKKSAAVFLLLGFDKTNFNVILTKRSSRISQPGDLCYPGGLLLPKIDSLISKVLMLPKTPLTKWSSWHCFKWKEKGEIALFLSTAFRESFEEMKLNPFRIELIGNLPAQYLELTNTKVYPFVCITKQKKFFLSSEVDKIIQIPISALFLKKNYSMHKLNVTKRLKNKKIHETINFPCFIHYQNKKKEIIWGLTYKITKMFLEVMFNFHL